MTDTGFTLVGDGIENPHNALAMSQIAATLGATCAFLDRKGLQDSIQAAYPDADPLLCITLPSLAETFRPIIAIDMLPNAVDVFGCRPAPGGRPALVVGNERLGLTHAIQGLAQQRIRIPMATGGIGSLNVAAAAAVVLYYLGCGSGKMQVRRDPAAHRPDVLLMAPGDHAELGCAIRSSAAFGWRRLLLEDRAGVWFGVDRQLCAEGRAAARRSKNNILVLPVGPDRRYAYDEAVVICAAARLGSVPLHRANLARGRRQLIVIPDEDTVDLGSEAWLRLGRTVRLAHLGVHADVASLRFRAQASIALAEVTRQVGQPSTGLRRGVSHVPHYDRTLDLIGDIDSSEEVTFADLLTF